MTSPASVSMPRCLAIACRVIGRLAARSVAVAGPRDASTARTLRRLGSASAANTSSATASGSRAGIEGFDELTQLALPPLDVAAVRAGVKVAGQLREAGFDHGEAGPSGHRLKGELDISPGRVARRWLLWSAFRPKVAGQCDEAGFDHGEAGPSGHRLKGELDIGPARIAGRQAPDALGVAEHAR